MAAAAAESRVRSFMVVLPRVNTLYVQLIKDRFRNRFFTFLTGQLSWPVIFGFRELAGQKSVGQIPDRVPVSVNATCGQGV
jgi:hypothetical protein